MTRRVLVAGLVSALLLLAAVISSQTGQQNAAIPLSKVPFAQDEDVDCLSSEVEAKFFEVEKPPFHPWVPATTET